MNEEEKNVEKRSFFAQLLLLLKDLRGKKKGTEIGKRGRGEVKTTAVSKKDGICFSFAVFSYLPFKIMQKTYCKSPKK